MPFGEQTNTTTEGDMVLMAAKGKEEEPKSPKGYVAFEKGQEVIVDGEPMTIKKITSKDLVIRPKNQRIKDAKGMIVKKEDTSSSSNNITVKLVPEKKNAALELPPLMKRIHCECGYNDSGGFYECPSCGRTQQADPQYHLTCSNSECDEIYWSDEAFPDPQLCPKCTDDKD